MVQNAAMTRVVLVPGFTQTAAAWDPVAGELRAAGHEVLALDIAVADDFVTTAAAIGDAAGLGTYVGYSMGGRLCLRLAIDRPDLVERLVLVSASPGIVDPAESEARRARDESLARDVERRGVEPFLRDWLAQPLFATLEPAAAQLAERAAGHTSAEIAAALRILGTGTQEPLWHRLPSLHMPLALVTGRADAKFEATNDAMQSYTTGAACTRVHLDGGHALPLEQPAALATFLIDWLAATG